MNITKNPSAIAALKATAMTLVIGSAFVGLTRQSPPPTEEVTPDNVRRLAPAVMMKQPAMVDLQQIDCGDARSSFSGSDSAGEIMTGDQTKGSCTLTFSRPWMSVPTCTVMATDANIVDIKTTASKFSFGIKPNARMKFSCSIQKKH